ncbi:LysR family transcriptional regulator [Variovorax dokdonensis]|uniref:LysR family transcriptional regulator n=1 Tax=Variovorax dokdonensis TaxID=344883 RepID=A0ABT7NGZ4_9BURK|nr:LysR family transcriptional regulator [Variovorax dokdonensis]MDM0047221.1 LysR family transcriptional regulator [Variovorax dokdonensis]
MQDLNDMVYFAEVAERGGFAAAGRALGIPKSRLSRRVADLEGQLGVQLLQRSTRSLSLTPAGDLFLRHCVAMRDAAQTAADAVAQVQSEPRGTIRVSCPVTMAQGSVGPLVARFMKRYPAVRVEMMVVNRPVDLIEEGVDVALRVRAQIEDSATLAARNFGNSGGILVASPELLRRQGPVGAPGDLDKLDAVGMSATGDGRAQMRLLGPQGQEHTWHYAPRLVADDLATLKFAVLDGIGASMLPDYMCRKELRNGLLVEVLPGWAPPPGIAHAMFQARRGMVPAVRKFIDFLAENLDGDEPHDVVI